MGISLYQYTDQYRAVIDMLEEEQIDPEVLFDTLDAINEDLSTKVETVGDMIREHEATKKALKEEAERLSERAKAEDRKIASLTKAVDTAMAKAGFDNLKGLKHTFQYSVSNSLICEDAKKLPRHFLKPQEPKPDIAGLKKHIAQSYEEQGYKLVTKMPAKPKGNEMLYTDLNEDLADMGVQFNIKRELKLKSK